MRVARWGSGIVLRYLGDAPLLTLTETYIRNHQSLRLRAAAAVDSEQTSEPDVSFDALLCEEDVECSKDHSYVQHTATKRTHVVETERLGFLSYLPLLTLCKWPANPNTVVISDTLPSGGQLCKDCVKAAFKNGIVIQ